MSRSTQLLQMKRQLKELNNRLDYIEGYLESYYGSGKTREPVKRDLSLPPGERQRVHVEKVLKARRDARVEQQQRARQPALEESDEEESEGENVDDASSSSEEEEADLDSPPTPPHLQDVPPAGDLKVVTKSLLVSRGNDEWDLYWVQTSSDTYSEDSLVFSQVPAPVRTTKSYTLKDLIYMHTVDTPVIYVDDMIPYQLFNWGHVKFDEKSRGYTLSSSHLEELERKHETFDSLTKSTWKDWRGL